MDTEEIFDVYSVGLWFYWYESDEIKEHEKYWGQVSGSLHRLVFVREEFRSIDGTNNIEEDLRRLEYHMENYLVRIYELRERVAKLVITHAGVSTSERAFKEYLKNLKDKKTRKDTIKNLIPNKLNTLDVYLNLLLVLDDDIDLRNQNTHDTFLSLGYSNGYDIFDPHDALIDLDSQPIEKEKFIRKLQELIQQTIHRYENKISQIISLTLELSKQLSFLVE